MELDAQPIHWFDKAEVHMTDQQQRDRRNDRIWAALFLFIALNGVLHLDDALEKGSRLKLFASILITVGCGVAAVAYGWLALRGRGSGT